MTDEVQKAETRDPVVDWLAAKVPGLEFRDYTFRGDTSITVPADRLLEVMGALKDELGYTLLVDIAGIHYPGRKKCFEVAYVVRNVDDPARFRVKVEAAQGEKIPSLTAIWPAANWHEREAYDMLGIEFEGHPDLTRIFMPDEFDDFPLRKEFPLKGRD